MHDYGRVIEIEFDDDVKKGIYARGRRGQQSWIDFWQECGIYEQICSTVTLLAEVGLPKAVIADAIKVSIPTLEKLGDAEPNIGVALSAGRSKMCANVQSKLYSLISDTTNTLTDETRAILMTRVLETVDNGKERDIRSEIALREIKLKEDRLELERLKVQAEIESMNNRANGNVASDLVPTFIFNSGSSGVK